MRPARQFAISDAHRQPPENPGVAAQTGPAPAKAAATGRAGLKLFRDEVLRERQSQWLGSVLLAPRISHRMFAAFSVLMLASVLSLLFFGEYTRKAKVHGWLVPNRGLTQIVAPQAGVVTRVDVRPGAHVTKGMPLVHLSTEVETSMAGATREQIVQHLRDRLSSMAAERRRQEQLFRQRQADRSAELASSRNERRQLDHQIELQQERERFAKRTFAQLRELRERQLITEDRVQRAEQDSLDQAVNLQSLMRNRANLDRDILKLEAELHELPVTAATQLGEIDRNISALEQQLADAEARREIVITAPNDGTVTQIQTSSGNAATPAVPLMSIVPAGSTLEAQLFSPSRAIGFVRPGQRVVLRYDAFPYQKFGLYEGTVADISRSALSPSEFPQQLSGLTTLYGTNEPIYRITVKLAQQSAIAYGAKVPLQPGMQLDADIRIETRRLIDWVLDPLYTLTGRS